MSKLMACYEDALLVMGLLASAAFITPLCFLAYTWFRKKDRFDVLEGWRTHYSHRWKEIWVYERPLVSEILKVVVFIMGIVHLFQGASKTNMAFSVTWTLFDVAVVMHLVYFCNKRYGKKGCFQAHMWCDLLYTITIGLGYGTAVKFSPDPSKYGPVFLTQSIIWGIGGVLILYASCNKKESYKNCINHKVLAVWLGVLFAKILYCVDLGYVGYRETFCVSLYLYYPITTCMAMVTIIIHEGSVIRNLPELVHAVSAIICCCIGISADIDPNFINITSHPATAALISMLILNVLIILVHAGLLMYLTYKQPNIHRIVPLEDRNIKNEEQLKIYVLDVKKSVAIDMKYT